MAILLNLVKENILIGPVLCCRPPGEETGVGENLKDCFLYFGCSEQVNAM